MEKYIFRGVMVDNNEMVYGYLLPDNYILTDYKVNIENEYCLPYDSLFSVIPETIGLNTQKFDKHNKQIFEGDILNAYEDVYSVVVYENGKFYADEIIDDDFLMYNMLELPQRDIEIIGNIHKNKDLLNKLKLNG